MAKRQTMAALLLCPKLPRLISHPKQLHVHQGEKCWVKCETASQTDKTIARNNVQGCYSFCVESVKIQESSQITSATTCRIFAGSYTQFYHYSFSNSALLSGRPKLEPGKQAIRLTRLADDSKKKTNMAPGTSPI